MTAIDERAPGGVFAFFTGCQRSGTTLLRVIFDAHPDLVVPPESQFWPAFFARRDRYHGPPFDTQAFVDDLVAEERFRRWKLSRAAVEAALVEPPRSLEAAIRRVYGLLAERAGATRFADKTPRYATEIGLFARAFPESRFVHVVRDGRDVALSLLKMTWGPRRVGTAALYWRDRVLAARRAGERLGPERYFEYHHEDLVANPEAVVRDICGFLDLSFDPQMLRYHESQKRDKVEHMRHLRRPPTAGLRDWRTQMRARDVRLFEVLAGSTLKAFGYPTVSRATAAEPLVCAEAALTVARHRWLTR